MTTVPRLRKDEFIRWQGSPDVRVHFTRADSFFVPFSIVVLGFALFWTVAVASSSNAPRFAWLFGLVFIVLGLYLVIGRFFVKVAVKRRTRYFLTDRRAIVVDPYGSREIALKASPEVVTRHGNDSHLDVVFGADVGPTSGLPGMASIRLYANTGLDFFAAWGPGMPIAFYDVADVDGLEDALEPAAA